MSNKLQVIIEFNCEFDKEYFLGQMTDGFGENFCPGFRPANAVDEDVWVCDFLGEEDYYAHAINMALEYGTDEEKKLAQEAYKLMLENAEYCDFK